MSEYLSPDQRRRNAHASREKKIDILYTVLSDEYYRARSNTLEFNVEIGDKSYRCGNPFHVETYYDRELRQDFHSYDLILANGKIIVDAKWYAAFSCYVASYAIQRKNLFSIGYSLAHYLDYRSRNIR